MKNVLITGASSGLGLELSILFAQEYHVILLGRKEEKLAASLKTITSRGGSAEYLVCDIRQVIEIQALKQTLIEKNIQLHTLINNAGIGFFGSFETLSQESIIQMLDTNTKGTILMTHSLLPIVEKKVINIISTAGLKAKINESVYVASKFAIRGFTDSLKLEYANSGVTFSAVYMGGVNTPFWENTNHIKDKARLKSPSEIAQLIYNKHTTKDDIII